MSRRGKRYDSEPKLNLKKVFAVIIAIAIIVMCVYVVKNMLSKGTETGKITSASYFALYDENKWGVIDNTGNKVIVPSYQEMIQIPNNKKDVFLCTYDINEETGEYKTKALNSKNEEIFTEYDQIEAIENMDKNNNLWYEEDVLKVQKNNKYGLIDLSGKEILPCEYDNISALKGIENSLLIQQENSYGLVNNEGTIIVKADYAEILALGDEYKDGYILVNKQKEYGVIDYLGKQLLEAKYEKIEPVYGKSNYVVVENGKQELINAAGEVVLNSGFNSIKQILEGTTTQGIIFEKDSKYGIMDLSGKVLIDNIYSDLKEAKDGIFIAKRGEKYGIIDAQSNIKIDFIYTNISYNSQADIFITEDENYKNTILDSNFTSKLSGIVSEVNEEKGYLKIREDNTYKYYNFKFEEKTVQDLFPNNTLYLSKKDGKYGYVNSKGDTVVDYKYDDATEQNSCGYVSVKQDGKWGSLDINGNVVIEPTYTLDNNYVIDFIGKWHLGQDVNMNYYCAK